MNCGDKTVTVVSLSAGGGGLVFGEDHVHCRRTKTRSMESVKQKLYIHPDTGGFFLPFVYYYFAVDIGLLISGNWILGFIEEHIPGIQTFSF